ncbi:hypothetical protein [Luteibaculum oceani]|uniref:hypothetical protein n=1 Tax=Luteibaculum oceani TaxID=1294296 RepID=UPI001476E439|nr:hypothetical protein [Luteibaculum oceani]
MKKPVNKFEQLVLESHTLSKITDMMMEVIYPEYKDKQVTLVLCRASNKKI